MSEDVSSALATLEHDRQTGVLIVGDTRVWVDSGRLVLIVSPNSAEPEAVLFAGGEGDLDEIATMLATQDDVAATLVARNPGAEGTLRRILHEHNLNALFELLVPSDITPTFEEGARHPIGATFAEPIDDLIDQARRRLAIWGEIASRIPSTSASFRLSRTLPEGMEERAVSADEWRYLAHLDGHRSVADVITETRDSAFRVCSTLYRLLLEGVIEELEPEA